MYLQITCMLCNLVQWNLDNSHQIYTPTFCANEVEYVNYTIHTIVQIIRDVRISEGQIIWAML